MRQSPYSMKIRGPVSMIIDMQEGCKRSARQEFIDIVRPCTCYVENVATSAGSVDVHEAVARARLNQSSAGFVEKPLDGAPGFVVPGSVLDHVSQV
jgi:hypothetical protein